MKNQTISSIHAQKLPVAKWALHGITVACIVGVPNLWMALKVAPIAAYNFTPDHWYNLKELYLAIDYPFYLSWLLLNATLIALVVILRIYFLQPLSYILHHLQRVRNAYHEEQPHAPRTSVSIVTLAADIGRFAGFALEYYRKHDDLTRELTNAQLIIAQFTLHHDAMLGSTSREIGTQYRGVLAYANYLEEQIRSNKLDPMLRYDFDEVCESSFNLKLIAGALAMLTVETPPHVTHVPLAALMQRTMLALAPALDRRNMKLTTAEVEMDVAAHGDPGYIAHILWMMLLGMVRYAADESTLRIRCLHSHDGSQALMSIVVTELSPNQLSETERADHLTRHLQHLTPHMFAETIRIHGNIQLAELLLKRMSGSISVLPLTTTSCEICMALPSATI